MGDWTIKLDDEDLENGARLFIRNNLDEPIAMIRLAISAGTPETGGGRPKTIIDVTAKPDQQIRVMGWEKDRREFVQSLKGKVAVVEITELPKNYTGFLVSTTVSGGSDPADSAD